MKKYIDAQLKVVRVLRNDIITMSVDTSVLVDQQYDGGRRMDDFDAGY